MNEEHVLSDLERYGVLVDAGHVVYTSGKHGKMYFDKDKIYTHALMTSNLCRIMAEQLAYLEPDMVIAPAMGGIILSQWMAYHLTNLCSREVLSLYAEKRGDDKNFVIRPTFAKLISGKRVLVVEDVLTTGGSVEKVVWLTRSYGGKVASVAALINRGQVTKEQVGNVPKLLSLVNVSLEAWNPADCSLCKKNIPISKDLGKGKNQ